jgi:ribbon-helix-helix CopG family protein
MKEKVGTVLESELMRAVKRQAAAEGRSISDLIQEAVSQYLRAQAASPRERRLAFQIFCEKPIKISKSQLRQVLDEDPWNL